VIENILQLISVYYQLLVAIDKGYLPKVVIPVQVHSIPPHESFSCPRDNISRNTAIDTEAKLTSRLAAFRIGYIKV
jgi:hypothetical protein